MRWNDRIISWYQRQTYFGEFLPWCWVFQKTVFNIEYFYTKWVFAHCRFWSPEFAQRPLTDPYDNSVTNGCVLYFSAQKARDRIKIPLKYSELAKFYPTKYANLKIHIPCMTWSLWLRFFAPNPSVPVLIGLNTFQNFKLKLPSNCHSHEYQ